MAAMAEEFHGEQVQSGSGDFQKRDGEGVVTVGMSPPKKLTKTEALEPDVGAGATVLDFEAAAMAEEFHGEQVQDGSGDSQKRDGEGVVTVGMSPPKKLTKTEAPEPDVGAGATVLDFEAAASAATEGEAIPSDLSVMGLEELSAAGLKPDDANAAMEDGCGEAAAAECDALIVAGRVAEQAAEEEAQRSLASAAPGLSVASGPVCPPVAKAPANTRALTLEAQLQVAVDSCEFALAGALQGEIVAEQRVAALEMQVEAAVEAKDLERAGALQSELRAARTVIGSGLSPMVCAAQKPVVVALEAQLRGAVQSKDYLHASELQSELRAARDAARRRLRMRKVAAALREFLTQFDDAIIENITSFVLPLV